MSPEEKLAAHGVHRLPPGKPGAKPNGEPPEEPASEPPKGNNGAGAPGAEVRATEEERARVEFATVDGVEKRVTTFESLNKRYALLQAPGKPSVYISRPDLLPITDSDLIRRLAGEVVLTTVKKKNVYVPAYKYWTGNGKRHAYTRIAFANQKDLPPDVFNLYTGLGVAPCAGSCKLILEHIREVITSGDAAVSDALVKLMAWQIQNIGKPSRIIVVLISKEQQIGKGALLEQVLLKIFGPSGFAPANMDQVLGRFNDTIRGKTYIFLDEVVFAGDRRAANAVKRLATATCEGIDAKGIPVIQYPIGVNIWMASNNDNAAHVEESDVRYLALRASEHRANDHAYFAGLFHEIENGGLEAFAHHLLTLDVSNFVPQRDVPRNNAAKQELIKLSINPYDARKWIEDCCRAELLIGRPDGDGNWVEWKPGQEYSFGELQHAYVEWQKTVKTRTAPEPTPSETLGALMTHAGFGAPRTRTTRMRALPDPKACLEALYTPMKRGKSRDDGSMKDG